MLARYLLLFMGVALIALGMLGTHRVRSQTPSSVPGCVYNSSLPTLTDRQTVTIQCDVNGRIIVH